MSLQSEIWSKIQMIQNLAFRILFLKYYFGHAIFLYSSARSSGHIENYKNNILPQQNPQIFLKSKTSKNVSV